MDEKNKLMAEFGLTADALDFSIEGYSLEELRAKFEAMTSGNGGTEPDATGSEPEKFELDSQFFNELYAALVQWMKPYTYHQESLENVLNTKDFSTYSPAELLLRISNAYTAARKEFTNMMREYSYNHGDLTDLHLH